MKLSIIIPYFNTKEYTDELLDVLSGQMKKDVEVILIDDGSDIPYTRKYKFLTIIRTKNGGQSKARNLGLNTANGDYIQFIDSDDMVSDNFVERLLEEIAGSPDLIEYSWRSLNTNGAMFNCRVSQGNRLWNPSACTRCFSRELIGNVRFNEQKDACEDEEFTRKLGIFRNPLKVSIIPEYMYFYRTDVEGSNTKRYKSGLCKTKRIVYFYEKVTKDRKDILKEIKKDDEKNEVFLLTYQNDIPELELYCQIRRPYPLWTHYLKGEPYKGCNVIQVPERYKTILFINYLHVIGGIESFIYHFAQIINFTLVINSIPVEQREKLSKVCEVVDYNPRGAYYCDNLIMLRILDKVPNNIFSKRSIRMCHGCRTNPDWHISHDTDFVVNVSEASKSSFGEEAKDAMVIHNPITKTDKKALILVSATRIPAPDKGNNEQRMRTLADRLNEAQIPFIWFNFSDGQIYNPPRGMINLPKEADIQPYIKRADYLVQLSDSEAWSYSILEALVNGTAVLVTPFPSATEMGIEDGKNGYIIPFDMGFDVTRIRKIPKFKYEYSNEEIKKEWEKLMKKHKPKKKGIRVRVMTTYQDTELKRLVSAGETITVSKERAERIINAGFGEAL